LIARGVETRPIANGCIWIESTCADERNSVQKRGFR
jgi:hypothetical protein